MHRHPSPSLFFWKQSIPGQFLLQLLLCRAVTTNHSCVQHLTCTPAKSWDIKSHSSSTWARSRSTELLLCAQGSCWKHHPLWYLIQSPNHPGLFQFCSVLKTNLFSWTLENYSLCMHYVLKVFGKKGARGSLELPLHKWFRKKKKITFSGSCGLHTDAAQLTELHFRIIIRVSYQKSCWGWC